MGRELEEYISRLKQEQSDRQTAQNNAASEWKKLCVLALLCLILNVLRLEGQAVTTHGTVNILLANSHGLVAETDSKLSSGIQPRGYGQKLFKLDDHTICTIAGFYRNSGPRIGSSFPMDTVIPELVNTLTINDQKLSQKTVKEKLDLVGTLISFAMEFVLAADQTAKVQSSADMSQITVAGYDGGELKIFRVDLKPSINQWGFISFTPEYWPEITVGQKLVHSTAGLDDVAFLGLNSPGSFADQGDGILSRLKASLAKDGGASLTATEMLEIADDLELKTVQKYPQYVGGDPKVAVLSDGKITVFPQVTVTSYLKDSRHLMVLEDIGIGTINNPGRGAGDFLKLSPTSLVIKLCIRCTISNVTGYSIDNSFFTGSDIKDSVLTYNGTPVVSLDGTNTIENSTLILGPNVDPNGIIVSHLRTNFPGLYIQAYR